MHGKERRFALVCYGGISLAVYMHGITKEIWHLVRASRAPADDTATTGSEAVYAALLDEMETRGDVRVHVLADIVAGASAGGINGIFLAQAIATGQSLDPLTELWMTSADVEALIDPETAPHSRFSKARAAARVAGGGTQRRRPRRARRRDSRGGSRQAVAPRPPALASAAATARTICRAAFTAPSG